MLSCSSIHRQFRPQVLRTVNSCGALRWSAPTLTASHRGDTLPAPFHLATGRRTIVALLRIVTQERMPEPRCGASYRDHPITVYPRGRNTMLIRSSAKDHAERGSTSPNDARGFPMSRRALLAGTVAGAAVGALGRGAAPFTTLQPLIARAQDVPQGGTLTYGVGFDVDDTLDPQVTNFDSTIRVTLNICEPLVWESEPGKFQPGLAESWEVSDDAKTYTFKLKQNVKFTDGTPFNAQAVKFTFDRVMDPATKA